MAEVQTTAGPVGLGDLGLTLIHEHMRGRAGAVVAAFPHVYAEEFEDARAIECVSDAMDRGVKTICDPTVMEMGRDIRFMKRVAEETGVQLVVATGIYTYHYLPPHFQNRDIEYMLDLFVRDIEFGIQGTDAKAAFIKCGTAHQRGTDDVEKVLRAAATPQLG